MQRIDGLVCDLDGVVYRGSEPIPGAAAKLNELRADGTRLVFATNNATKTVDAYRERLGALGIEVTEQEMLTSAVVAGEVVDRRGWAGSTAFVIGRDGIREELTRRDVRVLEGHEARAADLVVVSGDSSFDYDALRTAMFALRGGAHFLATNDDLTYPAPDGLWPGAGSILAAVEAASGRRAEVVGKPHRAMMEAAARRLDGCTHIAVVGDQPATDLAGGRLMGWTTILVLTGVTARPQDADPQPDIALETLADLRPA